MASENNKSIKYVGNKYIFFPKFVSVTNATDKTKLTNIVNIFLSNVLTKHS